MMTSRPMNRDRAEYDKHRGVAGHLKAEVDNFLQTDGQ